MYEEALRIDLRQNNMQDAAIGYNNISSVYDAWGRYDDAVEYLHKALKIAREYGYPEDEATYYNNIGLIYLAWGDYSRALAYIRDALAIAEELQLKGEIGRYNSNIGLTYMQLGRYREALDIAVRLKQRDRETAYLNNIGKVLEEKGDAEGALEYYHRALQVAEEMGRRDDTAVYLSNIGAAYFHLGNYLQAERFFTRTVAILEELRLTAPGAVRREYLASQIHNYRWLVLTYLKQEDPVSAFDTAELASAKYLAEQIGENFAGGNAFQFSGINDYCAGLDGGKAVLKLVELEEGRYMVLLGTEDAVHGTEVVIDEFLTEAGALYGGDIERRLDRLETRGVQLREKPFVPADNAAEQKMSFRDVIRYYRYLLSKPVLGRSEREVFSYIAGELYRLFFTPFGEFLGGKDRLVIIPDGPLSLIPFETLRTADGFYLAERFVVSYTPSLTVLEMIGRRGYSSGRKPLLGFGGAVYNAVTYKEDMVQSERHLRQLREEAVAAVSRGGNVRGAYSSMGIAGWSNLPGSLSEVRAIGELVPSSTVYTGGDVSEEFVKSLSRSGALAEYRQLHFATHGIVVPEIPELSAVVLSQQERAVENGEDGYLTMKEIMELDLKTDFVNLSACETGLGKVYSGEGVVGLTQAFLIAGTKGISVSLWQVADEATMRFMTGFYGLIEKERLEYSEALAEMKRRFIRDDRFSSPFFWAAFVYYGE